MGFVGGLEGWRVIGGDEGVGFYVPLMGGDRWGKREERAGWRWGSDGWMGWREGGDRRGRDLGVRGKV